MSPDAMLNRARAELLRQAPDCLARGPGSALLLSLDGDDEPVVDVFSLASIAVILWTSWDAAMAIVELESVPLGAGEVRVIVVGEGPPGMVVIHAGSGARAERFDTREIRAAS